MQELSLTDMLKAGMHFGHRTAKRHPKMEPFIFDSRKGISIIDLEKTKKNLEKAAEVAAQLASQGKVILFVGTKRQAKKIVQEAAEKCGMPFIVERWIGGLITNYPSVSGSMRRLSRLKSDQKSGELKKYTKKEQLQFSREIVKLDKIVGGIEKMDKVPDAIFVIGAKEETTAVAEVNKKGIPIIAICDTNSNPDKIDYPIPANDDAVKSIQYVIDVIVDAISTAEKIAPPEPTPSSAKASSKKDEKSVKGGSAAGGKQIKKK